MLTLEKMDEIIKGIDDHLQKLYEFTKHLSEIKYTVQELRNSQEKTYLWELEKLRREVTEVKIELQKRGLPEISQYELVFKQTQEILYSDVWPKAVDPRVICTTEDAAFQRAQNILNFIVGESLESKSFLDYGCGAGHIVMHAKTQNPKIALGYDINRSKIKFDNELFTTEFDMVIKNAPFDVVLMYDVLDHLEIENAVDVLKKLKSVLSKNGRIFIRNHPWCSKHGSHLYTQLNKAFAHLVFDEAELCRMNGYVNDHTIKLYNPIETYRKWFNEAGFKICSEIPITGNLEDFFNKQSYAKERLLSHWRGDELAMKLNMQIEFIEYVIEPISNQTII